MCCFSVVPDSISIRNSVSWIFFRIPFIEHCCQQSTSEWRHQICYTKRYEGVKTVLNCIIYAIYIHNLENEG